MSNRWMKFSVIVIFILAIIGVVAAIYFKPKPVSTPSAIQIDTENQPTLGNPNTQIQFVAFEDLKCINCAHFETSLFPKIKKMYIDTGKAKYTLINLAFIEGSVPAANAALCIYAQNKNLFFPFVDYLFSHQPPETENWATIPTLLEFMGHIPGIEKLDKDKLIGCLIDNTYSKQIDDNLKMAIATMGGGVATPALYINGMQVIPLTLERIEELVSAAQHNHMNQKNQMN